MKDRKHLFTVMLIALPSILNAAEPQGGTLIQMSSLGFFVLSISLLGLRAKKNR